MFQFDSVLSVLLMFHVCSADKGSEKKTLFEGATSDAKPKPRTAAEIKARYRETGVITII